MIVVYKCKCGLEFDGHWRYADQRRKQFPNLSKKMSDVSVAMVCPGCGNKDYKKNKEYDETHEAVWA